MNEKKIQLTTTRYNNMIKERNAERTTNKKQKVATKKRLNSALKYLVPKHIESKYNSFKYASGADISLASEDIHVQNNQMRTKVNKNLSETLNIKGFNKVNLGISKKSTPFSPTSLDKIDMQFKNKTVTNYSFSRNKDSELSTSQASNTIVVKNPKAEYYSVKNNGTSQEFKSSPQIAKNYLFNAKRVGVHPLNSKISGDLCSMKYRGVSLSSKRTVKVDYPSSPIIGKKPNACNITSNEGAKLKKVKTKRTVRAKDRYFSKNRVLKLGTGISSPLLSFNNVTQVVPNIAVCSINLSGKNSESVETPKGLITPIVKSSKTTTAKSALKKRNGLTTQSNDNKGDNFTTQMKTVTKVLFTEDKDTKGSSGSSTSNSSNQCQNASGIKSSIDNEAEAKEDDTDVKTLDHPMNRQEYYEYLNEDDGYYKSSSVVLPEDVEPIKKIGSGTFANVYLCKSNKTGQLYALKVIGKNKLNSKSLKVYALTEKKVLTSVQSDFIVSLKLSFQTKSHCYLLMDYCPGKDICAYLDEENAFNENKARFYICECIAAIHALHSNGIIHRDLKPNNIMLDQDGHIKLIDFNLCKTGMVTSLQRTRSFCGTPAYMPPEVLNNQSYGKAIDWYLVGVILYEMIVGVPPYFEKSPKAVQENILKAKLTFPVKCSDECKDLLQNLLQRNINKRLGNISKLTTDSGAKDVLSHPWFKGVTLEDIQNKKLEPFYPYLAQSEKECTEEMSKKELRIMKSFNAKLKSQLSLTNQYTKHQNKIDKWTFIEKA